MKTVRLLKTGKRTEYDDASADWLVAHGYAHALPETDKAADTPATAEDDAPPAPRRGRPPKAR
jgi:hypothetical protein